MTRTWTLGGGPGPATIVVACRSDAAELVDYTLTLAGGVETGLLAVHYDARPTTADFRPADAGHQRLAVYDIVGGTMQLGLGAPGAARPASLAGASVYTTR